jgi:hypothetical protein
MNMDNDLIITRDCFWYKNQKYNYESIEIYHNNNLIHRNGHGNKTIINVTDNKLSFDNNEFNIDMDFKIFKDYTLIYKYTPIKRNNTVIYRVFKD